MSRARSGSDWAFRARSTSEGVKPGLRWWTHVSNCFSSGVFVRLGGEEVEDGRVRESAGGVVVELKREDE